MPELRRILLAEDNPLDVEMALEGLAAYRLANEIDVVSDGEEALEYLRCSGRYANRRPGHPMLVLLDLKMPLMDGLDVLAAMNADADLRSIPVIVLTASAERPAILRDAANPISAYMVKPVEFHALVDAIKPLGAFMRLDNTPQDPARRA